MGFAFIGMVAISFYVMLIAIIAGVASFIAGNYLSKKTRFKKAGTALKIAGCIFFITALVFPVIAYAIFRG